MNKYNTIDVLVNNAGIANSLVPFLDASTDLFDNVMKTNVYSMFWHCKYLVPYIIENSKKKSNFNGKTSIINISSIAGIRSIAGLGPYVVSKHAVIGLSKQIANEYYQYGIRSNTICPTWTETPIIDKGDLTKEAKEGIAANLPLKRLCNPNEIMNMALFLASDQSIACNGQEFVVDQGYTSKL